MQISAIPISALAMEDSRPLRGLEHVTMLQLPIEHDERRSVFDFTRFGSAALFRGGVGAQSPFKVLDMWPEDVIFGKFVIFPRTKVDLVEVEPASQCEIGIGGLQKLLLVPFRCGVNRNENDNTEAVYELCDCLLSDQCLDYLQQIERKMSTNGLRLHIVEGQQVHALGEVVFLAKACEPRNGGFLTKETELFFDTSEISLIAETKIRLKEGNGIGIGQEDLQNSLFHFLQENAPILMSPRQSLFVPTRKPLLENERLRRRRLEYFQGQSHETEFLLVEWKVSEGDGLFNFGPDPSFAMQGNIAVVRQAQVEESAADFCMRCGSLTLPPQNQGRNSVPIYCCPCGQPVPNSQHAFWISIDRMHRDTNTRLRPSVIFLQELREVIAVMPMEDPRTAVLHSSLHVFTLRPSGEVDFDAADNLVSLIMPEMRQFQRQRDRTAVRRVDPTVLSRFPVSDFASIRADAQERKETECAICIETYDDADEVRILPCFHFFHKSCIDKWLSTANTCPVCKFFTS